MKKLRLLPRITYSLFFFSFLIIPYTYCTKINPQLGQSVWEIMSKLGIVYDETTPILISDDDAVAGIITIDASGRYMLTDDLTSKIIIDASNVDLDLNDRTIVRADATENIVTVNNDKYNVSICNGYIENSAGPGTGSGIFVNSGASRIHVEGVKILDCGNGIRLNGESGDEITNCKFNACDFIGNSTGIILVHSDKNEFRDCHAIENDLDGYVLYHSEMNEVLDCHAIDTRNTDTNAVSFRSISGNSNLFRSCIVKGTASTAGAYDDKVYGITLTGTETKTTVIDCIVNDTVATTSAVSWGINIEPILFSNPSVLASSSAVTISGPVSHVSWSPCERYIACSSDDNNLYVFSFDSSTFTLKRIAASGNLGTNTLQAAWSPDGQYIAVAMATTLYIFKFNGVSIRQIALDSISYTIKSLAWSPTGKNIVVGDYNNILSLFEFDGSSLTLLDDSTNYTVTFNRFNALAWSPDGNFITGANEDYSLRIIAFNDSKINPFIQGDTTTATTALKAVAWSPNGRNIVSGAANGAIYVHTFSETTSVLTHLATITSSGIPMELAWDPTGKYFFSANSTGNRQYFSFNGSVIKQVAAAFVPGDPLTTAAWSPSGKFIAIGTTNNKIIVLQAMYTAANCLLKGNTVANAEADGRYVGGGIKAGGCNIAVKNYGSNNEIDYSQGIPHIYYSKQHDQLKPHDNITTSLKLISLPYPAGGTTHVDPHMA